MSIKITNNENYIVSNAQNKGVTATAQTASAKIFEPEQPVKVSISKEGQEQYRKSIQENGGESYDSMMARREELLSGKIQPQMDYGFELGNKLSEIKGEDYTYRSTEKKMTDMLEAYTQVYEEIAKGYEDGSRSIYVEDSTASDGYRKLTMEEEIASLDEAYAGYVNFMQTQADLKPKFEATLGDYLQKISKINDGRAELSIQAEQELSMLSKEEMPENITEVMMKALAERKEQLAEKYAKIMAETSVIL